MVSFRRAKPRRTPPTEASDAGVDPLALLRRHAGALAAAARDIRTSVGEADLAGLIVAPGASRGDALRHLLQECHGDADRGHVCVGLVPGERLRALLRDCRFDAPNEPLPAEPMLVVVVDTAEGVRIGAVPWTAGGDALVPK